jgi:hypothetical protein
MDCNSECDVWEVLKNDGGETKEQIWIYCDKCEVETFYDLSDEE